VSALLALRLVTYLLVLTGVAALYGAALVGPVGAALVVLAILVGWGHEQARARGAVRPALGYGLVAAAAVAIVIDLFYLAYSILDGMVHLLLFLILLRLFVRRGLKDLRDAGLLSFFMLVAAASISFGLGFLVVFVVFLALGTWMLILNHVVTELERAGHAGGGGAASTRRVFFRGPLTRVSLVAAAITFSLAGALFFVIPRVGQAALPLRAQLGRMVTGFADRVDLGSFGDIETDPSVVMRIYLAEDPATLPELRWRGVAFDHFDGRAWSSTVAPRRYLRRGAAGDFVIGPPRGTGAVLRQEIFLEPMGTDAVFGAARVIRVEMASPGLVVDDMGGLTTSNATGRLHYTVESEVQMLGRPSVSATRPAPPLGAAERARFLQLPPDVSPEIARLAREAAGEATDPAAAARRIGAYLSTRYRYTLALRQETARPPLEEFLFVRRSGNCEYFAASMAVMLRTLGIPSRVIAGFQQGEWNAYGRYFMVRLSDAHSWVEVHVDGRGWIAFDPSPRGPVAERGPTSLSLYLDAARMRWYRYVINWSLRDQVHLAATVQRQATEVRLALPWPQQWPGRRHLMIGGGVAAALALGWLLWRRGVGPRATGPARRAPVFYERALRLLAREGLAPAAAETARQFAARVGAVAPQRGEPFARLTALYEGARFGDRALTEREWQDVSEDLTALRAR
jgi:transglutaminase-like putative cysteine protease